MKTKQLLFLLFTLFTFNTYIAQNKNFKDVNVLVVDSDKQPIANAIILFDTIKQNSKTNNKGIFKTSTNNLPKTISAFSDKHGIKTIVYSEKLRYYRIIISNSSHLKEKSKKTDSDFAKIRNKNDKKTLQYLDIYDYLRGQVSGLDVSPNNVISIRGSGNRRGQNPPLYILNGVQVSVISFENIIPSNIKSIDVLKGPDTAIYGLRGANGVLVIKTTD